VNTDENWAGLNVFDGETWQKVPVPGVNPHNIQRITFDNQGRVLVLAWPGDVKMYDGQEWTSIVQGDPDSNRDDFSGILADSQGRVWSWGYEKIQLLDAPVGLP